MGCNRLMILLSFPNKAASYFNKNVRITTKVNGNFFKGSNSGLEQKNFLEGLCGQGKQTGSNKKLFSFHKDGGKAWG